MKIGIENTTFIFVRYGETIDAATAEPAQLSEKGREQAALLGQKFKRRKMTFDAVVIAPTPAARETANILIENRQVVCAETSQLVLPTDMDGQILGTLLARLQAVPLQQYYTEGGRTVLRRFADAFWDWFDCYWPIQTVLNHVNPKVLVIGQAVLIPTIASRLCAEYCDCDEAKRYCKYAVLEECEAFVIEINHERCAHHKHIRLKLN